MLTTEYLIIGLVLVNFACLYGNYRINKSLLFGHLGRLEAIINFELQDFFSNIYLNESVTDPSDDDVEDENGGVESQQLDLVEVDAGDGEEEEEVYENEFEFGNEIDNEDDDGGGDNIPLFPYTAKKKESVH